jgi:hypothetical protein
MHSDKRELGNVVPCYDSLLRRTETGCSLRALVRGTTFADANVSALTRMRFDRNFS